VLAFRRLLADNRRVCGSRRFDPNAAFDEEGRMKLPLRYLALGLEIWFGVSAIVIGLYLLVFSIAGMGMNVVPGEFQQFAGFVLATLGVVLVVDAVRRELRVQVVETMERFGSPLDSPTQA
jgi:hypothetical protein